MSLIPERDKKLILDPAEVGEIEKGGKLDTGMKAEEAVRRACNWWESKGRTEMRLHQMRQAEPVGGSNNGAGASFAVLDPDNPNFLPSGIINGLPWDQLTRDEKLRVVKAWHHYFVRCKDFIGVGEDTDDDAGSAVTCIATPRIKSDG